jgi:macrolide-specific efflux system membrane fusion protein
MLSLWRRARWVRVLTLVLLVGVAGAGGYLLALREEPAQAAVPESTTTAVAASLTTIQNAVSASGTLTPSVRQDVSFDVSGTVTSVDVTAGDTVTAGQQLAAVDTLQLDAALLAAKADLAAATASLSDAQDEADGSGASDAQVAALAAQVDVAQAAVEDAEADRTGATLTAPVAGLVTAVDLAVGDAVSGGSSSGAGPDASSGSTGTTSAQFTIVGTDAWQVAVTVGESDVALIEVGDQAEITVDGATDPVYGTVGEVGLLPTSTSGVAAYPVTVEVTGSPEGLHDGESADVEIVYERRTDVLTVPAAAVTTESGRSVVTQEGADGEQVTTEVGVGATSGNLVEITAGLAEGDEVLVTAFSPRSSGSGDTSEQGGQMPQFSGEMPDFGNGQMPDFSSGGGPAGGQMPGGGNG